MNEDTLNLNIVIKADQTTLQDIYTTFVSYPALFDKLAILFKHTLESTVFTKDFEVELQHNLQIKHQPEPVTWS